MALDDPVYLLNTLQSTSIALNIALKTQAQTAPDCFPLLLTHPPALRPSRHHTLRLLSNALDHQWSLLQSVQEEVTTAMNEVRHQRSMTHSARYPASALPQEVLAKIFHFVIERRGLERSVYDQWRLAMMRSFTLSHICRDWRNVAVSERSLWTKYEVYYLKDVKHLARYFERCGDDPIDLHVGFGPISMMEVDPLRSQQICNGDSRKTLRNQLRSLSCSSSDDVALLLRTLSSTDFETNKSRRPQRSEVPLVKLETLRVKSDPQLSDSGRMMLDFRGIEFPALRTLHLVNTGVDVSAFKKLRNVEELILQDTGSLRECELSQLLKHTPNIRIIHIIAAIPSAPRRTMTNPPRTLAALETIKISESDEDAVCSILGTFLCPQLRTIKLEDIECNSEPNGVDWSPLPVGQADLPRCPPHCLFQTITHSPLLENITVSASPEALKALIFGLAIPVVSGSLQAIISLALDITDYEDRETEETRTHTTSTGRRLGLMLADVLRTRLNAGGPRLGPLYLPECMYDDEFETLADDVEYTLCTCSSDESDEDDEEMEE